jgi:hypothetical protein
MPSPPRVGSAEIEAGRCRMGPSWARRGPVVGLSRLMAIICGPQVAQRRHGQGRRRSHPAGRRRLLCAEREHRRKIDLRHRLKPRSVARRRLRNCRYPKASRMRSSGIRPPSRAGYSSVQPFAPCLWAAAIVCASQPAWSCSPCEQCALSPGPLQIVQVSAGVALSDTMMNAASRCPRSDPINLFSCCPPN